MLAQRRRVRRGGQAPEWWNEEELKALSARVVRVAPNEGPNSLRAMVMRGQCDAWEAGPRSAAELNEVAAHYERAGALSDAPAAKADRVSHAAWCRSQAEAM